MERRNVYSSSGYYDASRDPRSGQASRSYNAYRENQIREALRRQQLQQLQQQQQQRCPPNNSNNSGGFGYFVAALVGVVAGFLAKNFLYGDEEKTPKERSWNSDSPQNSQNQFQPQGYNNEASDPIDTQLEECNDIVCPITLEVMSDPVISKRCGHSFEGHAIVTWLRSKNFCPKCHAPLHQSDLVKNYSLKNAIDYMRKQAKPTDRQ